MDPQEAYDVFVAAACFSVQTSGGPVLLYELTPDQSSEIKAQSRRSDSLMLAKQYVKAKEAVEDLQKRLSVFPAALPVRGPTKVTSNVAGPPKTGVLVPYVKVAPPAMASVAKRHEYGLCLATFSGYWNGLVQSKVGKAYKTVFKWFVLVLVSAPLIMLWIFLAQFVLSLGYLAMHPEVFVSGFVRLMLNAPRLGDQIMVNIYNRVSADLSAYMFGT